MAAVALPWRGLASPGVAPCNPAVNSTVRNALAPVRRSASHVIMASGSQVPGLPGSSVVPQPSAGRAVAGGKSPQRTFSVMQSAMKIPGLASALHLIGVNGGHDAAGNGNPANGVTTVAAAGNNGAGASPDELPPPTAPPQHQRPADVSDAAAAAAAGAGAGAASDATVYEMAAAAASTANGHSLSAHQPLSAGGVQANGRARSGAQRRPGSHHPGDDGLSISDPVVARLENNIAPYSSGMPSLAVQIREIASTLRHINSLRVEYMEKISQQELELATKDQALRSREERIQELEHEKADLQRSLALLHSAKAAAEAEVQRLRAAAAAAPALPPALPPAAAAAAPAAAAAAAAAAAPAPTASTTAPQPETPAAAITTPTASSTPAAPPPPPPQPLTAPPAAVAASAPAVASAVTMAPPPAPAPTPAPPQSPPPPPPPRVPEIVLSYRSSWPEAYLQVNVDGRGWTAPPGLRMDHAGSKEYTLRLQARSIEFVLTNGTGEWDGPGSGPGRNYHIDTPGEYRLHYGNLTQTKPWQP